MKKRAFTEAEVRRLETFIKGSDHRYALRDMAILRVSLDSLLRVGDVMALKVGDVRHQEAVKARFQVRQNKTGDMVAVELTEKTQNVLDAYLKSKPDLNMSDFLFNGRKAASGKAITGVQWRRLLKSYCQAIGIDTADIGTHSIRKTIPTLVYQKSGGNLKACQVLLGHKLLQHREAYLSISEQQAFDLKRLVSL